ncbi:uncharacterized protein F54H12.2 [Trichonephila clavipes]|nr:uncharacterized protein F54H12.2 [Trichonephila clavipes]
MRLPNLIELKGEWEVGVVEFIYPHTWYNVNNNNNVFGFDLGDGQILARKTPPGFCESVPDILKAMTIKAHQNKIYFNYNPVTKRVRVTVKNKAKVILEDGLAQVLGFDPCKIESSDSSKEHMIESLFVADPWANYRVLLLYSDIVEPQIIGDVLAPLLRIVNVTGHDGEIVCVKYDRPHYLHAKAVGKQLFHSGADVLNDISKGDNFKVATQRRLKEAGRNLTEKASNKVKTMIGFGRRNKKRKQSKNNIIRRKSKKVKTRDIFAQKMTCLIHKDSPTCVKSELDLFLIPPTQTAIEKGGFIEYHPLANIRDGGTVEFNISGSEKDYMDFCLLHIYM